MALTFQYRSRSILSYYKRTKYRDSKSGANAVFESIERKRSIENLVRQETYTGIVTAGSQKRLTKAIEILVSVAEPKIMQYKGMQITWKLNFVTLTLYSFGWKVPGKEAHKLCLEPLLRWLRSKGMTSYVWKAELQSKRKDCHQLHYHLTTDVYIPYDELRAKWNSLQRAAGYLDHWFEKKGNWNPNSTDVHAIHNKKNLVGYLKKSIVRYSDKKKYQHLRQKYLIAAELAKPDLNKETVEGKVWDCSQNIKTSYYEVKDFQDVTERIARAVSNGELVKKEFERCTVFELCKGFLPIEHYLPWHERQFYYDHLKKIREYKRVKADIHTFSSS